MKRAFKERYLKLRGRVLPLLPLGRVGPARARAKGPALALKVLFIRNDRLGDMVLSTPVFKALKRGLPDSALTVLASSANASLVSGNPHVNDVEVYRSFPRILENVRLLKRLRAKNYDVVIDPMISPDLGTAVIAYLTGAPLRIGFAGWGREAFYSKCVDLGSIRQSIVRTLLALLEPLGITGLEAELEVYLSRQEEQWAQNWRKAHVTSGERLIALHPGGHYHTQRWGARNYAALGRKIAETSGLKAVLLGGTADRALIEEIRSLTGKRIPALITKELRKSIAAISRSDTLVCNNSGPLHIACALQVPTLSFMGPTVANLWGPVGGRNKVLRVEGLDCLECNSGACRKKTVECMHRITPEMAWEALEESLTGQEARGPNRK